MVNWWLIMASTNINHLEYLKFGPLKSSFIDHHFPFRRWPFGGTSHFSPKSWQFQLLQPPVSHPMKTWTWPGPNFRGDSMKSLVLAASHEKVLRCFKHHANGYLNQYQKNKQSYIYIYVYYIFIYYIFQKMNNANITPWAHKLGQFLRLSKQTLERILPQIMIMIAWIVGERPGCFPTKWHTSYSHIFHNLWRIHIN